MISTLASFALATQGNPTLLVHALKQTEKHYKRKYLFEQYHIAPYGTDCLYDTAHSQHYAKQLYTALCEKGGIEQEGPLQADEWMRKLTKNNLAYLKSLLFNNKKTSSPLSFKEELRLRLLMRTLQENIIAQKARNEEHPLWKYDAEIKVKGKNIIEYRFPGTDNWLARVDEEHPVLDTFACDEMIARLKKGEKLFIELDPLTVSHFREAKEYIQDGENTHYIFDRHFENKHANHDNIIACDYRYTVPGLLRIFEYSSMKSLIHSEKENAYMVHLIYFQETFDRFFKLKAKDILALHQEAQDILANLIENPHQFPRKPLFDKFYQEKRKKMIHRAQSKLTEMCIVDDLLEKNKEKSLQKLFGKDVNRRARERKFWNSYLELKLHDLKTKELAKDRKATKGRVNFKEGAEHGFREHSATMDTLQSDDDFIKSADHWLEYYRTSVQKRYFFYRMQKLMDEGRIVKMGIQTTHVGKIEIIDIINPETFSSDGIALLEVKEAINGKNVVPIAYNDMIEFYLTETPSYSGQATGLLATGLVGFLAWKQQSHATQDEDEHENPSNDTKTTSRRKRKRHHDLIDHEDIELL